MLAHRAGVPNLPPEAIDLDLIGQRDRVLEILCDAKLQSRPGQILAYHAVTGGFMLGNRVVGPFGRDNPRAFGHLDFSNVFTWADPDRALSVALLTTGKPVVSSHMISLFRLLGEIGRAFPRIDSE